MKITVAHGPLSVEALSRMAGGRLFLRGFDTPPVLRYICTDSREADGETLLVAMRGERVDGHSFIPAANRAGCHAFLGERLPDGWDAADAPPAAVILTDDSVCALGALARAHRADALRDTAVVAITGSVGKTTTKEMVAAVLGASGRRLFKKDGNFNSTVGLPLSVMEIEAGTDFAVLEMGMSGRGEILSMSTAARPDIALIVNIGSSHLEHLGTRENIARAKLEIAAGLSAGGILLCNGDEPLLARLGQDFAEDRPCIPDGVRALYLSPAGSASADYAVTRMAPADGGMVFDLRTPEGNVADLFVPAPGEHIVTAAAFAAVTGLLSGLHVDEIREGLAGYRPAAMRQTLRTVRGVTLIEDCYNAAPESMRAALSVLAITAKGRRLAVLGDMKELGADTVALHRAVGEAAARSGVDVLVTVGALGAHIAAGARDAGMPAEAVRSVVPDETDVYDATALATSLAGLLREGDTVLFKASRAMALERVSEAFVRASEENTEAFGS